MTNDELLARVEGLVGPDREVDALIICALLAPAGSRVEQSRINGAWCIYEPVKFGSDPWRLWERTPFEFRTASLTAGIDAALALVERKLPDVCVSVTSNVTDNGRRGACEMWRWAANRFEFAREHNEKNGHESMHQNIGAATPPLAIIAALLRALIAQGPK